MKKYIVSILFAVAATMTFFMSCNEDSFLEEKPLDFMSGNNSYATTSDYTAAVNELYLLVRKEFYNGNYDRMQDHLCRTDFLIRADPPMSNLAADMNPTGAIAQWHWENIYKLVAQANTIITRVPGSNMTDDQKRNFEAKARFFRGFAYRTLAYMYGGVPLQLEEVTSPKSDFTRATREEVLNQAIEDVKFAAENLSDITDVTDGEISAPAARFLLSELYLAVGDNQKAVDAATAVIQNPALGLKTQRFGSRANEPGDVYWDLFRMNNQNRAGGNTEGIWVIQIEPNVTGGAGNTGNAFWVEGDYWLERWLAPQTGLFRIKYNGKVLSPFVWPVGDYTGGRGIGTFYSNNHFFLDIWGGEDSNDFRNDIRNSLYNYPRKYKFNNDAFVAEYGTLFGDSIDLMDPQLPEGATLETGAESQGIVADPSQIPNRYLCAYQTKCTTPFNHPAAQYANKSTYLLTGSAGKTYTDQYMFRLAEAYLLRAEAYMKLGQKDKAAADINVVRRRAKASDATADQIDMDFILDERLRELGIEEKRNLTLSRTGTMSDRIRRYNPYYSAAHSADGKDFDPKYELLPIPQSFIEANTDNVIEQNPGY